MNIRSTILCTLFCLVLASCQVRRSTEGTIVSVMIEDFKRECIERHKANENVFTEDSIFYHVVIGVDGLSISASRKEYYYDLTPPPPPPPSMPDVIERLQNIENGSCCVPLDNDTSSTKECVESDSTPEKSRMEENEAMNDHCYKVYKVDCSDKNIVLYAVNETDLGCFERIVSPYKLIDISEYAQNFRPTQDEWDQLFIRMSCVFDVDSIDNPILIKTRYIE